MRPQPWPPWLKRGYDRSARNLRDRCDLGGRITRVRGGTRSPPLCGVCAVGRATAFRHNERGDRGARLGHRYDKSWSAFGQLFLLGAGRAACGRFRRRDRARRPSSSCAASRWRRPLRPGRSLAGGRGGSGMKGLSRARRSSSTRARAARPSAITGGSFRLGRRLAHAKRDGSQGSVHRWTITLSRRRGSGRDHRREQADCRQAGTGISGRATCHRQGASSAPHRLRAPACRAPCRSRRPAGARSGCVTGRAPGSTRRAILRARRQPGAQDPGTSRGLGVTGVRRWATVAGPRGSTGGAPRPGTNGCGAR